MSRRDLESPEESSNAQKIQARRQQDGADNAEERDPVGDPVRQPCRIDVREDATLRLIPNGLARDEANLCDVVAGAFDAALVGVCIAIGAAGDGGQLGVDLQPKLNVQTVIVRGPLIAARGAESKLGSGEVDGDLAALRGDPHAECTPFGAFEAVVHTGVETTTLYGPTSEDRDPDLVTWDDAARQPRGSIAEDSTRPNQGDHDGRGTEAQKDDGRQ
jgi:hypothetical protein